MKHNIAWRRTVGQGEPKVRQNRNVVNVTFFKLKNCTYVTALEAEHPD